MSTPNSYYAVAAELEAVKDLAFRLLMSDEISSIEGQYASRLFNLVGDRTENQADGDIARYEETLTR